MVVLSDMLMLMSGAHDVGNPINNWGTSKNVVMISRRMVDVPLSHGLPSTHILDILIEVSPRAYMTQFFFHCQQCISRLIHHLIDQSSENHTTYRCDTKF